MNLPKLIIFDMDGLLFDSERLFMTHLNAVMSDYSYTLTPEIYIETLGLTGANLKAFMCQKYGEAYPFKEITHKARESVFSYLENNPLPVKAGIVNLLRFIESINIPCCVASSSSCRTVNKYLQKAGLASYFTHITGGNEAKLSKPDPEIFLLSCSKSKVSPKEALVLEDSENGILAAHNAGIPVICIPDMKVPSPDIRSKAIGLAQDANEVIFFLESSY